MRAINFKRAGQIPLKRADAWIGLWRFAKNTAPNDAPEFLYLATMVLMGLQSPHIVFNNLPLELSDENGK